MAGEIPRPDDWPGLAKAYGNGCRPAFDSPAVVLSLHYRGMVLLIRHARCLSATGGKRKRSRWSYRVAWMQGSTDGPATDVFSNHSEGIMKTLIERIECECQGSDLVQLAFTVDGIRLRLEAWCVVAELNVRDDRDLQDALRHLTILARDNLPFNYRRAAMVTKLLRQAYYHGIKSVRGVEV